MSAHTATPWYLKFNTLISGDKYLFGVTDSDGNNIRATGFTLSSGDVAESNSAHIVKCVNTHDDLVAALNDVLRMLNAAHVALGMGSAETSKRVIQARAVLEKAKS